MGSMRIEDVLGTSSVRELRRLFEESPEAVVTIGDADGQLWWASRPGSLEGFGREPSAFIGANRFDFLHPEDRERARRLHGRALDGETVRYVVRARAADGRWLAVATVAWREDAAAEPVVVAVTTPLGEPDGPTRSDDVHP